MICGKYRHKENFLSNSLSIFVGSTNLHKTPQNAFYLKTKSG